MVLLKDFETELWKTGDRERFSSLYPNFALSVSQQGVSEDIDDIELDRFLDEWDDLSLTENPVQDDRRYSEGDADGHDGIKIEMN